MKAFVTATLAVLLVHGVLADNWPQWRGAGMNGLSAERNLPLKWSPTENIAWKLELPGWSGSSPIVWEDSVFLHVPEGNETFLWRIDRRTQAVAWKKAVTPVADQNRLVTTEALRRQLNAVKQNENYSTPSPVTDGQYVWVMAGTGVLKAFDVAGTEIWMRDIRAEFGHFGQLYGYQSSPLLDGDSLYLQVVHGTTTMEPSYVMRIDKRSGKTVWRTTRLTDARGEGRDAYRTPVMLRYDNQVELVVAGGDIVTGYDIATGRELWRASGLNPTASQVLNTVASPVAFNGIIYAPSRERLGPMVVLRAGGRDDVTATHTLWTSTNGSHVPSPVTDGQYFYTIGDRGIFWCLDAKSGAVVYGPQRVQPGQYTSSLVLADGKLYITNEEGLTSVVKAGPTFELLAENALEDYTLSSPAISDGQIFMRTAKFLWVIGTRTGR